MPIPRHFAEYHYYKTNSLLFQALARVHPPERGKDFDKKILQIEAKWIHKQCYQFCPPFIDKEHLINVLTLLKLDIFDYSMYIGTDVFDLHIVNSLRYP